MDCEKFNEYITEYEARRLTRKQELEFLQHKDVCEECNLVFNLVFNDTKVNDISYMYAQNTDGDLLIEETNYSDSICCSIMEKIQNIEQNSYNFKFYNMMSIVFGVITFSVLFTIMFLKKDDFYFMTNNIVNGTKNTVHSMNIGINNVSNTAINTFEQCIFFLYVLLIVGIIVTYLYNLFKKENK